MTNFTKFFRVLIVATVLTGLAACETTDSSSTGRVSVVITDAPTDAYERILITLSRMTLIGSGGQQVIYSGDPITFDLLQLRDRADFAFSQRIAAGNYSKIRLELVEVTLVDLGDPADPDDDGEVFVLDNLPANGKIDLNPRGPFTVAADRTTVVELDIDAQRSFQVVETGNGRLKLRPVIFVNVYNDDIALPARMTRVFGTVEAVDELNSTLLLCNLELVAQFGASAVTDPDSCVRVAAGDANHFGDDGMAFDFASLATAIDGADAARLTAIGFPSLPGAGAPDSIALDLEAVITEFGPRQGDAGVGWETTAGSLVTALTDCGTRQCIDFLPVDAASSMTVQLQSETRVFSRSGTELTQGDLGAGVDGAFDGLRVDQGGVEELRASLFITGPDGGSELVSGTLTAVMIGDPADILTVQPEGGAPVSVCVTSDTDLLRILVDDETVSVVDLLDPEVLDASAGLKVDAAGESGTICDLDASVVIIE